jgi:hypothetical protein
MVSKVLSGSSIALDDRGKCMVSAQRRDRRGYAYRWRRGEFYKGSAGFRCTNPCCMMSKDHPECPHGRVPPSRDVSAEQVQAITETSG